MGVFESYFKIPTLKIFLLADHHACTCMYLCYKATIGKNLIIFEGPLRASFLWLRQYYHPTYRSAQSFLLALGSLYRPGYFYIALT